MPKMQYHVCVIRLMIVAILRNSVELTPPLLQRKLSTNRNDMLVAILWTARQRRQKKNYCRNRELCIVKLCNLKEVAYRFVLEQFYYYEE